MIQARDRKGNFLYKWSIDIERKDRPSLYRRGFLARKRPIKRFEMVLNNLIKKQGLQWDYTSASLSIYEKWDYERNNPV
jgi:hypothetical protein